MPEGQFSLNNETIAAIAQAWLIYTKAEKAKEAWKEYGDSIKGANATDAASLKTALEQATSKLESRMNDFLGELQMASLIGAAGPLLSK